MSSTNIVRLTARSAEEVWRSQGGNVMDDHVNVDLDPGAVHS
jgi:hypothetical protein